MAISLDVFFAKLRVLLCFYTDEKLDDGIPLDDDTEPRVDLTKTLPEGVLAVIFLHCVALSVHQSSPFISPHPSAAPLALSQVNSFWRKVALNAPKIWSSIYVRNNTHHEILQLWLARSGTEWDLNLRIDGVHTADDLADANVPAFHPFTRNPRLHTSTRVGRAWSILASQIHRWRRVEFELDIQTAYDFQVLPLKHAIRLKDLSIQATMVRDALHVVPQILDYLRVSSVMSPTFKLNKLSWDCIPIERAIIHDIWGTLRKVRLSMGLTMDESVDFLSACVRAEEVTMGCITNDYMERKEHELQLEAAYRELTIGGLNYLPTPQPQRHVLPNIQRLSIGLGGVVGDCIPIVQFFVLPALVSLEVQSFGTSERSCALLEGFFARSAGSGDGGQWGFHRLSIVDHHMSEDVLIQLLCAPALGVSMVPAVNYYTRRNVRIHSILNEVEKSGESKGLEYYQDAWRGTWIGRQGLPDVCVLF